MAEKFTSDVSDKDDDDDDGGGEGGGCGRSSGVTALEVIDTARKERNNV